MQTLYKRAFQKKDKPAVYGQIMREFKTAKPLVYLLPLVVEDEEGTFVCFAKSGQRMQAIVNMAEESLIAMALHDNDELWNVQHSRALDRYSIDGTRTSWSTDTNAAKRFRAMLHQGRNSAKATRKIKPDVEVAAASIEAAGLVGAEASPMLPARAKGA